VISAIVLGAIATWALAPVLFLVLALLVALGVLSGGMIYLARRLRAWRERQ
jgi:hypothetical protein